VGGGGLISLGLSKGGEPKKKNTILLVLLPMEGGGVY